MRSETVGQLYPTFPSQDKSRYESSKSIELTNLGIDIATHASPTYLPPHWSTHVQAEGKPYFHRDGGLATVTESWIHTPDIASEADKWIDLIMGKVKGKNMDLATVELYIRVDEDMDCVYYLLNKKTQTLFWLEDYDTEQLGLSPVASPSHLRTLLEIEYWSHIDRFPAHFGGLSEATLLKLMDIFTHVQMDQVTSFGSTFTYSPKDTAVLLKVLKSCRGRTQEPEIVSTIARIWHLVQYNRFQTLYGEETPRLDSGASILEDPSPEQEGYANRILSTLSFGKSETLRIKLNSLFVDRYVYSHRVEDFISGLLQGWKEQYLPSFCMLLLHVCFFTLVASPTLAAVSAACFSASLLTAFALVQQHQDYTERQQSSVAINWMFDRVSKTHKFQRLSFALALPTALFNWGLIFFCGHWLFIALSNLNKQVAFAFIGIIGLVILAFTTVTSPDTIPTVSLPRRFSKKCSFEDESMV